MSIVKMDRFVGETILDVFQRTLRKHPNNKAVVWENKSISICELNTLSNALALRILDSGFKKSDIGAVICEPHLAQVAGPLALLKIGGVFLPVDYQYPEARIRYIIEHSRAKVIITTSDFSTKLTWFTGSIVTLDDLTHAQDTSLPEEGRPKPSDIAYVIFTSGSTGKPKGVMVSHKALYERMMDMIHRIGAGPGIPMSKYAGYGFDATIGELFSSFPVGAELHMISENIRLSVVRIYDYFVQNGIRIAFLPTQLFEQFVEIKGSTSLTMLYTGGDKLQKFKNQDYQMLNVYGPAECTVYATAYLLEGQVDNIPIGKAVAKTRIYILDDKLEKVPDGKIGEICIAGEGLGEGYLYLPEETEKKFVADPFLPNERMYRSGDLGCIMPDGNLEFHGRMDDQFKIRGLRIETGEIESCLNQVVGVHNAFIRLEGEGAGKSISALIKESPGANIQNLACTLRAKCREQLPAYMVPARFLFIDDVPLNANGKVNREKIKNISGINPLRNFKRLPKTSTEKVIAAFWKNELNLDETPGLDDHFIEIGGHSLIAAKIISDIEEQLFKRISFIEFLSAESLEQLSAFIDRMPLHKSKMPKLLEPSGLVPLSFNQQRPWLFYQMDSNSPAYNIPVVYHIDGSLNTEKFNLSIQHLMRRHQSLRSYFVESDGEIWQKETKSSSFPFQVIDFSEKAEAIPAFIKTETNKPFDLRKAPLFRIYLLKSHENQYTFFLLIHHIISDGSSISLLIQELSSVYNAMVYDLPLPEHQAVFSYRAYTNWQIDCVESGVWNSQRDYWCQKLKDYPQYLEFPLDYPRPKNLSMSGETLSFAIEKSFGERILEVSKILKTSPFNLFLSAFSYCVSCWCSQEQFLIGTMMANRRQAETRNIAGFLTQVVLLPMDIVHELSFLDFLKRQNDIASIASENQEYPYELIANEIQKERTGAYNPIYQLMFIYQSMDLEILKLDACKTHFSPTAYQGSKLDITYNVFETNTGLIAEIEYNTDVFCRKTIENLHQNLMFFLDQAIQNPQKQLQSFLLINPQERKLLEDCGTNEHHFAKNGGFFNGFEYSYINYPNKTALRYQNTSLSYRQLSASVCCFKQLLLENGRTENQYIGILLPRGIELIISQLAVLASANAFVVLDPSLPEERLSFILKDAQIDRVIADPMFSKREILSGLKIIAPPKIQKVVDEDLLCDFIPATKAYAIYTSGTTGTPKGVEISRKALNNFVQHSCQAFKTTHQDKMLQFASIHFDTCIEEIYPTLASAAELVIRDDSWLDSVQAFIEKVKEFGITQLDLPTAYWHYLTDVLHSEKLSLPDHVREVIIGGEAALPGSIRTWRKMYPEYPLLYNTYGPTETTVVATYEVLKADTPDKMPIGGPICNATARICDKYGRLLPAGAKGELLIGGLGLADAYIGRQELTQQKFVFIDGERYYKTGDLAYWNLNKRLEFVGRVDNQLKINGFRIEPEEIEQKLSEHESISEVAVVPYHDHGKTLVLAAYYVSNKPLDERELRLFLEKRLPQYMMPSFIIYMEAFPRTSNKKVDKKALPRPKGKRIPLSKTEEPPKTKDEIELSQLWCQALKLEQAFLNDNFFDYGGHSLLATQLLSRIRSKTSKKISLKAFLENPSLKQLVTLVQQQKADETSQIIIKHLGDNELSELSASQKRIWFLYQLEDPGTAYNIPISYNIQGEFSTVLFAKSVQFMMMKHQMLRASIIAQKGFPKLKIHDLKTFNPEYFDLTTKPNPQKELIDYEAKFFDHRFDFEKPPLFRISIIKYGAQEYRLLLNFHHLIADNWSVGVFIREINEAYAHIKAGSSIVLNSQAISYTDYISWHNQYINSAEVEAKLDFWAEYLQGAPEQTSLPIQNKRPARQTFRGEEICKHIDNEVFGDLKVFCQEQNRSLNMCLYSVFNILLHRYTGALDLVTGTPLANRNFAQTEALFGTLINNLPVRSQIDPQKAFTDYLADFSDGLLQVFEHQDTAFERIVDRLKLRRDLSYTPVFQCIFNYLNAHSDSFKFEGAECTYVHWSVKSSIFDLSLVVYEQNNGLCLNFNYNTDLFDHSFIRAFADHYVQLIQEVLKNPGTALGSFNLLTDKEKSWLFHNINNTNTFLADNAHFLNAFDLAKMAQPDKIALITQNGQRISYAELDARSSLIARNLINKGFKPGDLAAIFLDRNEDLIFSLLAVMKAGGAYIPLDPVYPNDRIRYILNDSNAGFLICHKDDAATLLGENTKHVDINELLLEAEKSTVLPKPNAKAIAYIIYTSGSTGNPKGVVISHKNLINFLYSMQKKPGIQEQDKMLGLTTISFDIAGLEIYLPLMSGATLVLAGADQMLDPDQIAMLIDKENITMMQATPVSWQMLILSGWEGKQDLKALAGGEALSSDLAYKLCGKCQSLWNMYGPTETTIWSTTVEVNNLLKEGSNESIGYPIDNTQVYVVNECMSLQPIETAGELLIGGLGVGKGYFNNKELSRSVFLPDPFTHEDGAMVYKTGDLVKMHANGNLEFLNRMDNQVKIRGFRIELDEIEACILKSTFVEQCVVIVREDVPGNKYIAAYLKEKNTKTDIKKLRKDLMQQLPDYMLPASFSIVDEIPLTPNGKIDRKRLPKPEQSADLFVSDREIVLPQTKLQRKLLDIWQALLPHVQLSIEDDFFTIGGHSLMAVQMMNKIEETFGQRLPLAVLFSDSSIEKLSKHLSCKEEQTWRSLVAIKPKGNKTPLFVVHGAGLNLLLYKSLSTHLDPEQPVYGLQAKGLDGKTKPLETMEEIAAHYISEIKTVQAEGPYLLAGYSLGGIIAYEMSCQLLKNHEKVAFTGLFDTVAYTSDNYLNPWRKKLRRLKIRVNQAAFAFWLLIRDPDKKQVIGWKIKSVHRMIANIKSNRKYKKAFIDGDKEKLQDYVLSVHEANNRAGDNYVLRPCPIKIFLFKAKRKTFYIEDFKTYSWDKYAQKGVKIFDIPGEHSAIFAPPNDYDFARILQSCIDNELKK